MQTIQPTKRARSKIAAKKLKLRNDLWPSLDTSLLWHRSEKVGFVTIPRAMPLIMAIMDDMAKGRPVSMTYLDLWCHTYDDSFVIVTKPRVHAFACGFGGQRGEATWAGRVKALRDLGFIDVKPGPSGSINYVLIWNPYEIIKKHRKSGHPGIREDAWNALNERMIEIGADDFEEDVAA